MQLFIDEFNPSAQLGFLGGSLQSAVKAIHNRQQSLERIDKRIFAKILLLTHCPFAGILELSLQTCQTVHQRIALRAELSQLAFLLSNSLIALGAILSRRQFMLGINLFWFCSSVGPRHPH